MCRLLDLPPEMVVWTHAPQHHYDLALNQSIHMYGDFSSEFYSKPSIPANPERRRWYLNMLKPLDCGEVIPDGVVWDVVCRWQGLRLLFDLYVDTAIRKSYVKSVFPYSTGLGKPDRTEESASEGDLPKPSQIPSPCANAMIPEDRKSAYERFYKALTAHWVAIETLWKVRTQVWPNAQQFDSAFESAVEMWSNNPGRPLKEKMDIIEIVDFIWGFLGRKAFHVASVPSWIEGEGDLVKEQYLDQNETEAGNWGFFVRGVTVFNS
ncbi:uncharacterized protein N7446_005643 [Penicillium canescens]|uniref:Uncharacterized protein n=1 Tax=Penicillium canescens TaxID=5083 RepID=A0AAD6NCU8_PENCN|nr:uncharacterized protein N7446_005643 [Penicillium canescens]KAJ6051012.1 hypothetical protein N7460_001546 [Penicillium canescens]KAJ6061523.1 hypothetical protein N7446_005643 [Penicillium canescens]